MLVLPVIETVDNSSDPCDLSPRRPFRHAEAQSSDRAPSSGRMPGSLHHRGSAASPEARPYEPRFHGGMTDGESSNR